MLQGWRMWSDSREACMVSLISGFKLSLLIFKRLSKENMQMGVRVLLANLLVHVFSLYGLQLMKVWALRGRQAGRERAVFWESAQPVPEYVRLRIAQVS